MPKICYVATVPDVLFSFMRMHVLLASQIMNVTLISHPKRAELVSDFPAEFIKLEVERKLSLLSDLKSLFKLIKIFKNNEFDIVHTIMPKTGLLGMFAAWLAGVPNRIHTFTGQIWVNSKGIKREIFKFFDRLIALLATQIIVDSPSQLAFLISQGIVKEGKAIVIGSGSICGVDSERFKPNIIIRNSIREDLKIDTDDFVILYVGRLNKDKGVLDLVNIFSELVLQGHKLVLLLVGSDDDISDVELKETAGYAFSRVRRVDFTAHPEHYMAASDLFCLPSYREGFGQVIIEAAAAELPTVASRIYGITDAVEDGKTGLLFDVKDVSQLRALILELFEDSTRRLEMGRQARVRSISSFAAEKISAELCDIYAAALSARKVR